MDSQTFSAKVHHFSSQSEDLLNDTLVGRTELSDFLISKDRNRATFNLTKSLEIEQSGSDRLSLRCEYRLCTSSDGTQIAIETSSYKVQFKALQKFVPIVRFEYERDARNKPSSHFQFHSDSVPLGLLLARAGKYDAAAHQQDVHFPMGHRRFRVSLEDVIELLVKEFGAKPPDGWQRHLDESRDKFYELQASSVIRDNIPTAISVLEDLGYTVSSP